MEINADILQYLDQLCAPQSDLLRELEAHTYAEVYNPVMISGPYQGRFLSMLSKIKQPKKVLEIGTYTGYSALCLAEGMATDGRLMTIERNPNMLAVARRFFDKSPYGDRMETIEGEAIQMLKKDSSDKFSDLDLVFLDANKKMYTEYVDLVYPRLKTGGLLIVDNVLWKGKVIKKEDIDSDSVTKSLHLFNQYISQEYRGRLSPITLPIRDGILLGVKQ